MTPSGSPSKIDKVSAALKSRLTYEQIEQIESSQQARFFYSKTEMADRKRNAQLLKTDRIKKIADTKVTKQVELLNRLSDLRC